MSEQSSEERPLLNMTELAYFLDVSFPTVRRLMVEPGFPIAKRGSHGVPYEFDATAVIEWKTSNEARLAAEREARAREVAQLRLDLLGGNTIDPVRPELSPRERVAVLEAEYKATQLARLRGELVRADEVTACLGDAFTTLRTELTNSIADVASRYEVPRELESAFKGAIQAALQRAAERLTQVSSYRAAGQQELLATGND